MSQRLLPCLVAFVLLCAAAAVHLDGAGAEALTQAAQRAQPTAANAAVTFSDTIAPIVYANCVSCHRAGEAAPFPLVTYEDVAKRGALIARVTESGYMPPWHAAEGYGDFVGERRLTAQQIASIAAWVKQGMPRGSDARLPALPAFPADGWRLGQPDLIVEMPVGFDIPAGGPDVFRNFVIPTRLAEDKWVRGVEFRPSARKVAGRRMSVPSLTKVREKLKLGSSICRICPTSCTPAWRSCSLVMMSTGAAVSAAVRPRAREPSTCTVSSSAGDVAVGCCWSAGGAPVLASCACAANANDKPRAKADTFMSPLRVSIDMPGLLLHVVVGALRAGGAPMRRT